MADTTKALQDKITKWETELVSLRDKMDKARDNLDAKKMEFMDGGHKADQLQNNPVGQKLNAEVTKLQHIYDEVAASYVGLKKKIDTAKPALQQYKDKKAALKDAKQDGAIDKDEYARRKGLCKEMLKDVGTVKESHLQKLNVRADVKKKELEAIIARVDDAESTYAAAKKFVENGFTDEAKKVADQCQKYFGKKNLNPAEAKKALKKLEDGLKDLKKEQRVLEDEVTLVEEKIKEGVTRIKDYQKDIARSLLSFQEGNMSQEELDRVMSNFKKTMAIK